MIRNPVVDLGNSPQALIIAPTRELADQIYHEAERIGKFTGFRLLAVYGGMLPSNNRRWCTKMLKLRPFEVYVGDGPVINYVGLRADENRVGYISTKPNISAVYPFREDGLIRADIIRILEDSGLGLPTYMEWGRSRSGCFFCFYQQKIEWVRLKEKHPDLFQRAKDYEEKSVLYGEQFYWCQSESLAALERPERVAEIKANWEISQNRTRARRKDVPLVETLGGMEHEERALSAAAGDLWRASCELHAVARQELS